MSYDRPEQAKERIMAEDLARLRLTLDGRFWLAAGVGTLLVLLVLGVPSAVIPNPFFVRMIPAEPVNVAVWLTSAPLAGLLIATYVSRRGALADDVHAGVGAGRVTLGGVAAYLAIGCPICNKIVVAALGVSGALNVFGPLQPLIGAGSVAVLASTLAWRLRMRARGCARCVSGSVARAAPLASGRSSG
jgi:hypothetical protein